MNAFASRMSRVAPSAIMELLKTAAGGGYINFASGLPAVDLFPHETLRAITDDILTKDWQAALQYGTAEGYGPLRELVAQRLKPRGIDATADNILITNGSQQALDLAARLFLDSDIVVSIESPSYLAAIQAFNSYEIAYESAPMDDNGVDVEVISGVIEEYHSAGHGVFQFVLPNFQNPTGLTLSLARRQKLAELCAEANVPLLEDDAYYDLRFEGEHLPPIAALVDNPFAMYTGTFSKTIAPGLRVGWIHGGKDVIAKLAQLKQITDLHSGSLTQRVAFEFCARDHLGPQIAHICDAYRSNRDVMLAALERAMPTGVRWTKPLGGMFVFLKMPPAIDSDELLTRAMQEKLMFVPGRSFFPTSSRCRDEEAAVETTAEGRNTLRLNFVSSPPEVIELGVVTLANLIKSNQKKRM